MLEAAVLFPLQTNFSLFRVYPSWCCSSQAMGSAVEAAVTEKRLCYLIVSLSASLRSVCFFSPRWRLFVLYLCLLLVFAAYLCKRVRQARANSVGIRVHTVCIDVHLRAQASLYSSV